MPWTCRFIEKPALRDTPDYYPGTVDFDKLVVGDMVWYHHQGVPCGDEAHLRGMHLTAFYWTHHAKRRAPLICKLPGGIYFLIDGQCYSDTCTRCGRERIRRKGKDQQMCQCQGEYTPRGYYDGWTVEGRAPFITVKPSILYTDNYHGYLRNGVITDDIDGRKFDAEGRRV